MKTNRIKPVKYQTEQMKIFVFDTLFVSFPLICFINTCSQNAFVNQSSHLDTQGAIGICKCLALHLHDLYVYAILYVS